MSVRGPSAHDRDTVQRLLAAAAHEFARHGFAATRIRDVVEAAGANLAAVNYHFGDKDGLYRATIEMLARRTQQEVPRESPELRALPPEDQLQAFTRVILGRFLGGTEASPMSRIIAHELLDPTPAFETMLRDVVGPQFARLTQIVGALLGPRAGEEEIKFSSFSVAGQWAFFLFGRQAFGHLMTEIAGDSALLDRLAVRIASFSIAALRARRLQLEAGSGALAGKRRAKATGAKVPRSPTMGRRRAKSAPTGK